jgi:hypothetical protein
MMNSITSMRKVFTFIDLSELYELAILCWATSNKRKDLDYIYTSMIHIEKAFTQENIISLKSIFSELSALETVTYQISSPHEPIEEQNSSANLAMRTEPLTTGAIRKPKHPKRQVR